MLVIFWDQGFEGVLYWLVTMEANHDNGTTLYASSQNEEAKVHKKQGHGVTLWWQVLAKLIRVHTPIWSHLPFKGMMVAMFGGCEANTILVLLTRSMPLSPSTQFALANGHCEATFASIKLLFYWVVLTLQWWISLSIVHVLWNSPWWFEMHVC